MAVFNRIVTRNDLAESARSVVGPIDNVTLLNVRVAEWSSILAVLGAFGALGIQYAVGANIDGLSGIDIDMCRSMQQLHGKV